MARGCLEMLAAVFYNTASVDQWCNLTPVTSVTTFKNWWQLGFHPKFAIDTLSFYSVTMEALISTVRPRWHCSSFLSAAVVRRRVLPLPSNRHHRSNDDCLESKREYYQVCSVQYCAQQLCTVQCRHIWTDLTILWIGFCLNGPISLCLDSCLYMYYCMHV